MLVHEVDNLLLGHGVDAVELLHLCLPWTSVDECLDEGVGTAAVAVKRTEEVELEVVLHRAEELFAEVATLKLVDFCEEDVLHGLKSLTLIGLAHHHKLRIVAHINASSTCSKAEHRLIDIKVEQTGSAVVEHICDDVERIVLQ